MNSNLGILLLFLMPSSYCFGQSMSDLNSNKEQLKLYSNTKYFKYLTPVNFQLTKNSEAESVLLARKKAIPIMNFNKAFFCKIEHKLTSSAHLPLRMRVGNLDYVNFLEGKGFRDPNSRY